MRNRISKIYTCIFIFLLSVNGCIAIHAQEDNTRFFYNFDESCKGSGGNDDVWNDIDPAYADLPKEWNAYKIRQGNQCLIVGTGADLGYVVTPAIQATNQDTLTLTFKAGAWKADREKSVLRISIEEGSGTLSTKNVQMQKGKFTEFTIIVTKATNPRFKFTGESDKGNSRFFLDYIKVTANTPSTVLTKQNPNLKFDASIYKANLHNTNLFNQAKLECPADVNVIFSSSNDSIATIQTDGTVLLNAEGKTTITAISASNEVYDTGSASYELDVLNYNYEQFLVPVTEVNCISEDKKYSIIARYQDADYALVDSLTNENKASKMRIRNITTNPTSLNEDTFFSLSWYASKKGYHLKSNDRNLYFYYDKSANIQKDTYPQIANTWTLSTNQSEKTPILLSPANEKSRFLKMSGNQGFGCYSGNTTTETETLPTLYEICAGKIYILTPEGYGTIYTDKSYVMPEGLKGTTIQSVNDEGELTLPWEYQAGQTVPAHTALLVFGKTLQEGYPFYEPTQISETVSPPTTNLLHGTLKDEQIPSEDGTRYYKLAYNKNKELGFFWGKADGAPFVNAGYKAYLAIPGHLATALKGFTLPKEPVPTHTQMPTAITEKLPYTVFTLAGVRIHINSIDQLPAGFYIINGKKTLVP